MKSEEHIDRIVDLLLKSRKMDPPKIAAFAQVIRALANVNEREETPNKITQDDETTAEAQFGSSIRDLSEIEQIEIDGQHHKVKIVPNN